VTGLSFRFHGSTTAHTVGIIPLIVLAVAIFARYSRHLAGHWRWTYVVAAAVCLINPFAFNKK
jgi:multisubunit Na+/H+ antiporter MnhG subunit